MWFEPSIDNPILQLALSVGESTIREACDEAAHLQIAAHLSALPDGRDAIHIALLTPEGRTDFQMVLRSYFDQTVLRRVARRAWRRRHDVVAGRDMAALGPLYDRAPGSGLGAGRWRPDPAWN